MKYEEKDILASLTSRRTKDKGFRMLLSTYKEPLYWHVRKIVGVHQDADDVVQNMWVKVYQYIDKFEGNSGLYTWLYRIATNEALSLLRKRKKHLGDDDVFADDWSGRLKADQYFDGDEAALLLERAVMTLPDKQKEVFLLRYYQHMSYRDISEVTGVSEGGLKAQYHHAKNKIEDTLKNIF